MAYNQRPSNREQDDAQRSGATCPYCSQPLSMLAPDSAPPSGVRALGAPQDTPLRETHRSMCQRCGLLFEADGAPPGLSDEDRRRVLLAAYRARRAHDRFRMGHEERFRAVSELAEAFVGLQGAPGVRPFSATTLHTWACEHPLDDGLRAAVAFTLHVADAAARWKLRFEVVAAMKAWDTAQHAVFVEWTRRPWWA